MTRIDLRFPTTAQGDMIVDGAIVEHATGIAADDPALAEPAALGTG